MLGTLKHANTRKKR